METVTADKNISNEEFQEKYSFPHCDSKIMHSVGTCIYCDKYPERQQYRIDSNTNFSNENDPNKLPCPSTYLRSAENRDRWYGNVPVSEDDDSGGIA